MTGGVCVTVSLQRNIFIYEVSHPRTVATAGVPVCITAQGRCPMAAELPAVGGLLSQVCQSPVLHRTLLIGACRLPQETSSLLQPLHGP